VRYALLILAGLLFFLWLGAFVLFHVVGLLIHVILLIAIILFVVHLFSQRRAA